LRDKLKWQNMCAFWRMWIEENIMADENAVGGKLSTVSVSPERVQELMSELQNRLMLVTDRTLNHLQSHGALPAHGAKPTVVRADGCCKPDGGTCCVNKKLV
jgi:hypothetical protein